MKYMLLKLRRFSANDIGATAIEYALIASLMSIAIVGTLVAVNDRLVDVYDRINDFIVPALGGSAPSDEG